MYIVIEYFNYRKNSTISILGYTDDEDKARELAYKKAYEMYGEEFRDLKGDSRFDEYVILEGDIIVQYSTGDGYDKWVYSVVRTKEIN